MNFKTKKILLSVFLVGASLAAGRAFAFSVGDSRDFNVDPSYDYTNRVSTSATVQKVGQHAIFYAEDAWWNSLANKDEARAVINKLSDEFDNVIYPRLTSVFGLEWSPGIDNEFKIIILVTKMKDKVGGYFNLADEYPRIQSSHSNEGEIIYFNSDYLTLKRAKGFLAHEFQHMITFYQKEKSRNLTEEIWLNEARSEYAATLCGYDDEYSGSNLEKRVNEFLRTPNDSLTEWQNETADYASVNLFMQYLAGRYGEKISTEMMRANAVGAASIDQALSVLGYKERFRDVFTDWTIANLINDCALGNSQQFCYANNLPFARFHLTPSVTNFLSLQEGTLFFFSDSVRDWSGHWYELAPTSAAATGAAAFNLLINFRNEDSSASFKMPILISNADGTRSIKYLTFDNGFSSDIILNFGTKVKSVILIPSSQTKPAGSFANELSFGFSYAAKVTASTQAAVLPPKPADSINSIGGTSLSLLKPNYPDGSLIRSRGDYKVYVIEGRYKRWLQSPLILAAYPHLGWQSIIEVTPSELDGYQTAWFIRAEGDVKVYEVNGDLTRHWLNMSAEQFSASGRNWDTVFAVNKTERDLYRAGAEVVK